jgi:hypothetical protein
MDKKVIESLITYYECATNVDPGIAEKTVEVLKAMVAKIDEEAAAAAKKRKSPNKSGLLQIDPETGKIVAEFETQKQALAAIGKEGKSGIGDAVNARTKTHKAYGWVWVFKDEYDEWLKGQKK